MLEQVPDTRWDALQHINWHQTGRLALEHIFISDRLNNNNSSSKNSIQNLCKSHKIQGNGGSSEMYTAMMLAGKLATDIWEAC